MKKIIVLSLLAVILTGCVKQADYDELQEEITELKKDNRNYKDEITSLKTENENLKSQLKEYENKLTTPSETNTDILTVSVTIDDETICHNLFYDKDAGTISYKLNREENDKLNLTIYYDLNIDTDAPDHELKNTIAVGCGIQKFQPYVEESKSLDTFNMFSYDHQFNYCNMMCIISPVMSVLSAYERDGTAVEKAPKWADEASSNTNMDFNSLKWIENTIDQIEKEISPYLN